MSNPDVSIRGHAQAHSFVIIKADIHCPHCGYFSAAEGPRASPKCATVICHKCSEAVMIQTENIDSPLSKVIDYYPKRVATVDPFVLKDIAEDYLEAQRCFSVAAWHGCAVMARRCMHSVAEHFKADGDNLHKQIEDLKAKQIITPVLAEQAQHIRILGKHGAHPYDMKGDQLKDLGMEDAQAALEFCDFIFDQVFVLPEKIKASKSRLTP